MNAKAFIAGNTRKVSVYFVGAKLDRATEEVVREPTYASFPDGADVSAYEAIARKLTGQSLNGCVYASEKDAVPTDRGMTIFGTFAEKQGKLPTK